MVMSYSQGEEEKVILEYFKDFTGILCDIGCNDGKTFSNSLALIEKGWKGLLIEPSNGAYLAAEQLHKSNKKVNVFNCQIGRSVGYMPFYDAPDSLLSSASKELAERGKQPVKNTFVFMNTWESLLKLHNIKTFDFITIDAEGMDWTIIEQIDLKATKTKLLCIEYGNNIVLIKSYCLRFGLKEIFRNGENIILASA